VILTTIKNIKRTLIALLMLIILISISHEQACAITSGNNGVVFKDKKFEKLIRKEINKPKGIITEKDVGEIVVIDIDSEEGITDLAGIEHLK